MATTEAPKMLFYRIEQCQEFATLAGDPYTQMQILNTVICILMQVLVLPSKSSTHGSKPQIKRTLS